MLRLVNCFMNFILNCQRLIIGLEKIYNIHKRIIMGIFVAMFILIVLSIKFSAMLALIFVSVFFLIANYMWVTRWYVSVVQFMKFVLFYNIFFLVILIGMITTFIKSDNLSYDLYKWIFLIAYFILWFMTSMIAKLEVSRLVNEIISAILTIVFTAGTYISSTLSSHYSSIKELDKMFNTMEEFERVFWYDKKFAKEYLISLVNEILIKLFWFILPILCISIFCLVASNVKEYWLKKNGLDEHWNMKHELQD